MTSKVYASAADAVADITDGATLAVGGFGLCGIPDALIEALAESGATDLEVFSNNCGVDGQGLGVLLGARTDPPRHRLVRGREQGVRPAVPGRRTRGRIDAAGHARRTDARRRRRNTRVLHPRRCGQPGLRRRPAVALRRRRLGRGRLAAQGDPRLRRTSATCWKSPSPPTSRSSTRKLGDTAGNLVFNKTAMNFNPLAAMAGRITIAQVEELVEPGDIDPGAVHLPGVFVQRIVHTGPQNKQIEKRTVRAGSRSTAE